jgi:arylsulfatase A-like enzyme
MRAARQASAYSRAEKRTGGAAFRDTCLIIDWPDGIREGGSLRRYRGQLPDIMATVLEITGAKYRGIYDPNEIAPL